MVILKILTAIRPPEAPILNLHVDYSNRPESALEAEYLIQWVNRISHGGNPVDDHDHDRDSSEASDPLVGEGHAESILQGSPVTSTRPPLPGPPPTVPRSCTILVRCIDEVTRGITDRDVYEKVTRDIRYGMYKEALSRLVEQGQAPERVGVLLGHHADDVRENVVSNVMRWPMMGCKSGLHQYLSATFPYTS